MKPEVEHCFERIRSYEDLVGRLRNWATFGDAVGYDYSGMVHLLEACLENLREYAAEEDLDEIGEYIRDDVLDFLVVLAGRTSKCRAQQEPKLTDET